MKTTNFGINFSIEMPLILCQICEPAFTDHSTFLLSQQRPIPVTSTKGTVLLQKHMYSYKSIFLFKGINDINNGFTDASVLRPELFQAQCHRHVFMVEQHIRLIIRFLVDHVMDQQIVHMHA